MNCVVVVLVGGMGTRIRHLLDNLPKPLAPVNGQPFLEWVLRFLLRQKLRHIIFSTGYLADKIEIFASKNTLGLDLKCAREDFPLGTAGGVLNALDKYKLDFDNVLVLNGDSLALTDFSPLFRCFKDPLIKVAVLGVQVPNAERFGTLATEKGGYLAGFKEKQAGSGLVNAGIYLFRKEVLEALPRGKSLSFELDVFPKLLMQNVPIKVIEVDAPFIDIGTEDSLGDASLFIEKNYQYFLN
jgi:D-glycero-alpha-D-manno-heptose 1-phosphate guanylyltransferase